MQHASSISDSRCCRLVTRNGFDFAGRFPLVVEAIAALPAHSCVVDGEAIAVDDAGLSAFDLIRYRRHDHDVTLCAFDLLELDGEDMRRMPIELRKATLKSLLRRTHPRRRLQSALCWRRRHRLPARVRARLRGHRVEAAQLALSRRPQRCVWVKIKNPAAPAVKREAEEDWGRR